VASILIIDDNQEILEMLRLALNKTTLHQVLLSTNGPEGLSLARSEQPELAIVDVMMPKMSGYEVVRELRKDPKTADMSIIILTARGQAVDKVAALEAGADHYIAKPVKPQDLVDEIERLLSEASRTRGRGIYPVISYKGGVGKTTLAVNFALLFQQLNKTVLVDLSTNTGHCTASLGLPPRGHWGNLLPLEKDQNPQKTLGGLLQKHKTGLHVLSAPPYPRPQEELTQSMVNLMISTLVEYFSFLVIDMPAAAGAFTTLVYEKATRIVLVSGSDPFSIHTTRNTFKSMGEYRDKVLLVLNTPFQGKKLSLAAVEKTLGMPISAHIPFHSEEIDNKMKGSPAVISQPESPMSFHLHKIIRSMFTQKAQDS
jgi:DNA-binding response OmpR family regulator